MKAYSIVRIGNEYIVQAGTRSILKISSRRRAMKLVTLAAELLDQDAVQRVDSSQSISRDPSIVPDDPELS
jgi:hypothetical protein